MSKKQEKKARSQPKQCQWSDYDAALVNRGSLTNIFTYATDVTQ
jgi:hypothetical protein